MWSNETIWTEDSAHLFYDMCPKDLYSAVIPLYVLFGHTGVCETWQIVYICITFFQQW